MSSGSFVCVPCAKGVVGFVRQRSVYYLEPRGSFVCVRSIPVSAGVRSCTFDPFPCALGDRRVRLVDSRVPWS